MHLSDVIHVLSNQVTFIYIAFLTTQCHDCTEILFKEINTFIHTGFIKLIKSDSKDMYNVTKDFYFK